MKGKLDIPNISSFENLIAGWRQVYFELNEPGENANEARVAIATQMLEAAITRSCFPGQGGENVQFYCCELAREVAEITGIKNRDKCPVLTRLEVAEIQNRLREKYKRFILNNLAKVYDLPANAAACFA